MAEGALEQAKLVIEYWQKERAKAVEVKDAERVALCDDFIEQSNRTISSLKNPAKSRA